MRTQNSRSEPKPAESLAIQAITFLANEPERLSRFLAMTGIDPSDIRALVEEQSFLAAVLEHFCADEQLLIELAAFLRCEPAEIDRARTVLSGGDWERDTA